MTTNEFYYYDGKKINSEKAHALKDKTTLIVSNRSLTAVELAKLTKELKGEEELK